MAYCAGIGAVAPGAALAPCVESALVPGIADVLPGIAAEASGDVVGAVAPVAGSVLAPESKPLPAQPVNAAIPANVAARNNERVVFFII